jgi:hypothetical protein
MQLLRPVPEIIATDRVCHPLLGHDGFRMQRDSEKISARASIGDYARLE